jgi:transposase
MDHIAIDLGSRESQVCVRRADGEILEERRVGTGSLGKYLQGRPKSRVVLEACAEAFAVADASLATGHETVVVPESLGVGDRGIKTDVRDARNLSEASCRMSKLPMVHVPTKASRDRKAMCGMREGMVQARTKLINTVRGWTRPQGWEWSGVDRRRPSLRE